MTTTDVQGIITLSNGDLIHLWANGFTDTSETELKARDISGNAQSIGTVAGGKTIKRIEIQCSDGSYAGPLKYNKKSGQISHWLYGTERQANMGVDIDIEVNIPVEQGDTLLITTQD